MIALGGNALLERGESPDAEIQEHHVRVAVEALAPLAADHELFVTHGNGPQVGMLALESAADEALSHAYAFDVLDAQTQGMIGYWLAQALTDALPDRDVAAVVTRTVVSADDPSFAAPTKFVGPVYDEATAHRLAGAAGWTVRQDGPAWRRVVPSPRPEQVLELPTFRHLLDAGTVVVGSGGGGIPVVRDAAGRLVGVDAVIDKDATAELLAEALGAELLLLLTDVPAVEVGYGTPDARPLRRTTPSELRSHTFPAGSMGPKVDAVCRFVETTGHRAAIGRLADVEAIVAGRAGTDVVPDAGPTRTPSPAPTTTTRGAP